LIERAAKLPIRSAIQLTDARRTVLETGIRLHRWWEARWRELEDGPLLQ